MLFRYWLLFTSILAIMTIAARIMYRVMRYGMHKLVPEALPAYLDERGVMQVYLLLIEWFILVLLNRMRRFIITSAFTGLPLPLRNRVHWLAVYATAIWLLAMGHLSGTLWGEYGVFRWDAISHLLMITTGMGVMMGIVLPFCNLRYWDYIFRNK